ncbi:RNA polymerase sigma factor [Alicyclobacillus sp. SO9]|uniref:RNA polymerase sigma factor n=1 Tax=Alicyclobacillus sp. SO9 TaxID=2665646 RepID=UPI0018E768C8|nr:sigma-70 family RNA polymerase sigma factor [Alicyclobacillus sp. SO9]QQE78296.1 sigma-70 family RNA polymerase sigma factor [Alicyclobacillus sp. SO9]
MNHNRNTPPLNAEVNPKVELLYRQYASDVYGLALSSMRNPTDAEDAVQEVFLRVLKNWSHFRGEAHVKTWIFQIARNYLIDVSKRKTRTRRLALEMSRQPAFDQLESIIEVKDMLNDLSQNQREVINLRIVHDLSVADTAHVMQCSEGKVRTDTHRALKTLRGIAR